MSTACISGVVVSREALRNAAKLGRCLCGLDLPDPEIQHGLEIMTLTAFARMFAQRRPEITELLKKVTLMDDQQEYFVPGRNGEWNRIVPTETFKELTELLLQWIKPLEKAVWIRYNHGPVHVDEERVLQLVRERILGVLGPLMQYAPKMLSGQVPAERYYPDQTVAELHRFGRDIANLLDDYGQSILALAEGCKDPVRATALRNQGRDLKADSSAWNRYCQGPSYYWRLPAAELLDRAVEVLRILLTSLQLEIGTTGKPDHKPETRLSLEHTAAKVTKILYTLAKVMDKLAQGPAT